LSNFPSENHQKLEGGGPVPLPLDVHSSATGLEHEVLQQINPLAKHEVLQQINPLAKHEVLQLTFAELTLASTPFSTFDNLDLASLVSSTSLDSYQAASLSTPFSLDEIRTALFSINDNASPGPDCFGPAFFNN
jgi:hypothetical protein